MSKPKVLVVCTGNSMRSQMAEGLLRYDLGNKIEVYSAGTHPSGVHPLAIEAMNAIGIDISHHTSNSVQEYLNTEMDLVITVCDHAKEACPHFHNANKRVHKGYPDPIGALPGKSVQDAFACIRDQMRTDLRELVIKELSLDD